MPLVVTYLTKHAVVSCGTEKCSKGAVVLTDNLQELLLNDCMASWPFQYLCFDKQMSHVAAHFLCSSQYALLSPCAMHLLSGMGVIGVFVPVWPAHAGTTSK
jgi:hypothetical protein